VSAVQTLQLDARRRAMLEEMGVKVWWPMPAVAEEPAPAPAPVETAAVAEEAAPVASPRERVVAEAPAPVAARRPAPAAAPLAHGAAVLVEAPRRLYAEAGAEAPQGGWLVVADMPPEADGRHGEPFAGEAGKLLDNMLRALGLQRGTTPVHLMRTHRGVAAGQPGSPRPIAEAFEEHAAALAPQVVLAMGPLAAQSLMQSADPLGKLRGRAQPLPLAGGAAVVVATYHPAYLLRNPADKARAWADLCLAAEQQQPAD
jgi:DNA polymerase